MYIFLILQNSRIEASIDKFGNQIQRQTNEIIRLKINLNEKETNFKKLRREIGKLVSIGYNSENDHKLLTFYIVHNFRIVCHMQHNVEAQLKPYLQAKEIEFNSVKSDLKSHHLLKIYTLQQSEMDQLNRVQIESNKLLQNNYLLLSSTNNMCGSLREDFERIRRLNQRQNEVTFDEDRRSKYKADDDLANLTIGVGLLNGCPVNDDALVGSAIKDTTICLAKRSYDECGNDEGSTSGLMLPPSRKLFKEDPMETATLNSRNVSPVRMNLNETVTLTNGIDPTATVTKQPASTRLHPLAVNKLKAKSNLMRKIVVLSDSSSGVNNGKGMIFLTCNLLFALKIGMDDLFFVAEFKMPKSKYPLTIATNKENKRSAISPGRLTARKSPRPKTPRMMMQRKSK